MKTTTIFQKILPSIINVAIVFVMALPLLFIKIPVIEKQIIIIFIFFLYTFVFLLFNKNRDLGMIIIGTFWKENYPFWRHLIFNILYTASFATLFFWIRFPFDLFILNMVFLQLPAIIITGTTFHGFLSGKMTSVKK